MTTSSTFGLPRELASIVSQEFRDSDTRGIALAQHLVTSFLTASKPRAVSARGLIDTARNAGADWGVRRLAVLMLEHAFISANSDEQKRLARLLDVPLRP